MTNMAERRRGMTLIEIAISVLILAGVLGVPVMLLHSGSRSYAVETASTAASEELRKGIDDISTRLSTAFASGVLLIGQTEVQYNRCVGYQSGSAGGVTPGALKGPMEQIRFEYSPTDPDDGLDNDGDGLVDEGLAVWIEGTHRVTLADTVPEVQDGEIPGNWIDDNGIGLVDEEGLAFKVSASSIEVYLTVASPDADGNPIMRSMKRTIAFRN